jgi:outer membrane protein TolC
MKNDMRNTDKVRFIARDAVVLMACACCLLILWPPAVHAQETIAPGEKVDLERCVDIALKNHPSVLGAAGTYGASRSRIGEARAPYWPQVSAGGSYSRNRAPSSSLGTDATYNRYQGTVDVNQTLLDFGKTSAQVDVQKWGAEASREDLRDVTNRIVFGVKQAYYTLIQTKRSREAQAEAVKQFQLHLEQAKRFYSVGVRAKIDVTNAEVNLGQARLDLINAENAFQVARVTLNNAMGLPGAPEYEIEESPAFKDYPIDLDTALARGYENRPDLQAADARTQAAQRSIDVAQKGYYPVLSGNAQYGWSGQDTPLEKGWTLGASLDVPLFSGYLTKYQVEEMRYNLEAARANEASVRQTITLDIQQAYYNLQGTREKVSVAELTMKQAQENRELAQGRYAAGVGNTIEVTDAVVSEVNARTAYIRTQYDYRIAVADLEQAMGEQR